MYLKMHWGGEFHALLLLQGSKFINSDSKPGVYGIRGRGANVECKEWVDRLIDLGDRKKDTGGWVVSRNERRSRRKRSDVFRTAWHAGCKVSTAVSEETCLHQCFPQLCLRRLPLSSSGSSSAGNRNARGKETRDCAFVRARGVISPTSADGLPTSPRSPHMSPL